MKTLNYVTMIALMFFALQSCNNSRKGTTQKADSSNKNNTSYYQNYKSFNKRRDTNGVASLPTLKVDSADAEFAMAAVGENLADIYLSVIALQITKDVKIKGFADSLITGHMKLNDQLSAIAGTKNIRIPSYVSPERQKNAMTIAKKTGKEFDRAYLNEIGRGIQKSAKLYQSAAVNVKDSQLKEYASKATIFIKKYPNLINKINSGLN